MREWPQFVAMFLIGERKLVRGRDQKLTLYVMGLEFLGLISRQHARECLQ